MITELARLQAENINLRAALAVSKDPCVYCQLPAAEQAKCKYGFPGCSRADDQMGCPEFGASMELARLRDEIGILSKGIFDESDDNNPCIQGSACESALRWIRQLKVDLQMVRTKLSKIEAYLQIEGLMPLYYKTAIRRIIGE